MASLRAGGASRPSRTLGKNQEVIISPSRLDDDSCNFHDISSTILPQTNHQSLVRRSVFPPVRLLLIDRQSMAISRGSCRGRVFWRPHMPHTMLAMPSHVQPYPHGLPPNVPTLPSGPFDLAEQELQFAYFFLSQFFQTGWERLESNRFDNQSAAVIRVDTIEYDFIPSVPSRLEGDKTRPHCVMVKNMACIRRLQFTLRGCYNHRGLLQWYPPRVSRDSSRGGRPVQARRFRRNRHHN